MKVINLFGSPGAGKSSTAAGLFYLMKFKQFKVELVTEYAKELVYEKHYEVLADQLYVLAQQNRRVERLRNEIDYVITDSPILLSLIYAKNIPVSFGPFVLDIFKSYDNTNFFIKRVKSYIEYGRMQTEEESDSIGQRITDMLIEYGESFTLINGDEKAPEKILTLLTNPRKVL